MLDQTKLLNLYILSKTERVVKNVKFIENFVLCFMINQTWLDIGDRE